MSNNLDLTQVATNQANPEVPVNDKGGELDAAITESLTVDLTNSAATTAANYRRCARISVTPTGASKTLTLPAVKRMVLITNDGTLAITIARGATSAPIAAGGASLVYTDGTTNGLIAFPLAQTTAVPYDIGLFVPGTPTASQRVLRLKVVRAFTWPISLTGSYGSADTAATGSTTFTIKQNGASIGTIVFAASAAVATFTFAAAVTFAAGDVITIDAPGSADATLANVAFNFAGTR